MALRPNEPVDIYDLGNGKFYVVDTNPGEWLEYTVNIAQKGLYEISASIAAVVGGGTFSLKIGTTESEVIKAPSSSSWTITKPVTFSMNLEAGTQIMRLSFIANPVFYIDYFDFKRIVPLGISPASSALNFQVFQTSDHLNFSIKSVKPTESLKIYNILGSLVKTIQYPEPDFQISSQEFKSGIYIVQIISGEQKLSQKIAIH